MKQSRWWCGRGSLASFKVILPHKVHRWHGLGHQEIHGKVNNQGSLLRHSEAVWEGYGHPEDPIWSCPSWKAVHELSCRAQQPVHPGNNDYMSSGSCLPACFWRFAITCVCHLLNVEPGEDEVSAWCKLHGGEFKGEKIPFGALVYFKPSVARKGDQSHKFDPKGMESLLDTRSHQLPTWPSRTTPLTPNVWSRSWRTRILLRGSRCICLWHFHAKKSLRGWTPLDGLAVRDHLDGSPDFIHEKEEDDDDDDGGDSEDGDDGSDGDKAKRQKLKSSDTGKKIENQEHEFDRCMREFEKKYLEKKEDPPAPPPAEPPRLSMNTTPPARLAMAGSTSATSASSSGLMGRTGRVGPDGRKEIKLETLPDPRVTTLPKSGKLFRRKKEVSSSEEKSWEKNQRSSKESVRRRRLRRKPRFQKRKDTKRSQIKGERERWRQERCCLRGRIW